MAIGESRHKAKNKAKEEMQRQSGNKNISSVDVRIDTIHSINTYKSYLEHCNHFIDWCVKEQGYNKYTSLNKLEDLAKEYLQYREEKGLSLYTLKAEKAALGKLYNKEIDYKFKEKRTYDKITRSRNETTRDKHFSEEKNKDLVNIARGTGGRREDIEKLTTQNFFYDNKNNMWVSFQGSKGGRDRIAPVLPEYKKDIEEFLKTKEKDAVLFDRVHNAADIHAYRREYAKNLYELVKENKDIKEELLKHYPEREKTGYETYFARGDKETRFTGNKDDIYIVSQALGHNRLGVSVNHYLK